MLERLLAILSVVLVAYIVSDKWLEQASVGRLNDFQRSSVNKMKKLMSHSKEFNKPEVIKVTEGIYVAVGFALANSILLEGPEGAIIIDTVESVEAATEILKEFRKVSSLPIKSIIYTHNHQDHVGGTEAFVDDPKNNQSVQIWSHKSLIDIFAQTNYMTGPIIYKRAVRQFGFFIERENTPNSGIGIGLKMGKAGSGFIPPNKFLDGDSAEVKIAGLTLQLLHIPGETDDQIAVYWPDKRALFCADDVYKAFPNLYAIRGTPFRSLDLWTQSLDKMNALGAEFLVPSHTKPIVGEEKIRDLLYVYRDAVQIVHDQTVRWMNKGLHPDEIAMKVKLPPKLAEHEYLQEFYGTVPWSVKGLFAGYLGWFSGYPEDLNPLTPQQEAERLVSLAGGEKSILESAEKALAEGDAQWALKLASAALRVNGKSTEAREIKVKSIFQLATTQQSANGYNYYTTWAYEEMGKADTSIKSEVVDRIAFSVSLKTLFRVFRYRLNFEQCSHLDKLVQYNFTDVKEIIRFHLRQGVLDLVNTNRKPQPDIKVEITSSLFRKIVASQANALLSSATGEVKAEPGLLALREVMACFERQN